MYQLAQEQRLESWKLKNQNQELRKEARIMKAFLVKNVEKMDALFKP